MRCTSSVAGFCTMSARRRDARIRPGRPPRRRCGCPCGRLCAGYPSAMARLRQAFINVASVFSPFAGGRGHVVAAQVVQVHVFAARRRRLHRADGRAILEDASIRRQGAPREFVAELDGRRDGEAFVRRSPRVRRPRCRAARRGCCRPGAAATAAAVCRFLVCLRSLLRPRASVAGLAGGGSRAARVRVRRAGSVSGSRLGPDRP